jgi:hypothetical protein
VIPQWRDTSIDMTERRSTATSHILLSMKLRHSLVREEGSLALPRKPQLLEVSGQALNRPYLNFNRRLPRRAAYAGAPPRAPGSGGPTSGAITCFGGLSGGIF